MLMSEGVDEALRAKQMQVMGGPGGCDTMACRARFMFSFAIMWFNRAPLRSCMRNEGLAFSGSSRGDGRSDEWTARQLRHGAIKAIDGFVKASKGVFPDRRRADDRWYRGGLHVGHDDGHGREALWAHRVEGRVSGAAEVVGEVGGAGEVSGDEACDIWVAGEGCVMRIQKLWCVDG